MKITRIRTTPLLVPPKEPYHWSQGVSGGAAVVLIEVETDEGVTGIGESIGSPTVEAVTSVLEAVSRFFIGQPPHDIERLFAQAYQEIFAAIDNTPRFASRVFAGLEMALWDVIGKAAGQPVHRLLGGAAHQEIQYFGFLQGDTAEELAEDARDLVAAGFSVIYMKIGRGEEIDMRNVAAVRQVIGDDHRLRLDANEVWDPLTAIRMIRQLSRFDPEFIEQPTPSHSIEALVQVKEAVDVAIAADQCVFTPAEVYEVCRRKAADMIVLGPHETGGLLPLKKAAAIAEAAGINICLHGIFETGITTCAANQIAATIPNLDDGNQIMCQLLSENVIASPGLTPTRGRLAVSKEVGLGFQLDDEVVGRAAERFREQRQNDRG